LTPKALSPCIRNCCLDADDVCMGCARTLDEILQWSRLTNPERLVIMNGLEERHRARAHRLAS
jgi:predicted Fe-S protein YdhL (DUF1289 family)